MNDDISASGSSSASDGRFAKGKSGNPRGRPRKTERAYNGRQIRHDVLNLMETVVEIKVNGKTRRLPMILAVYWRMLQKALEGDARMIRWVIEFRRELIREHSDNNPAEARLLQDVERDVYGRYGGLDNSDVQFHVNQLRIKSRKL